MIFAVGDFGSNTFRLQISHFSGSEFVTLDVLKENVRLAAGLDENNELDSSTVQKALDCFARFGERLRQIDSKNIRLVGTNTLRVMNRSEEFLSSAEKLLGSPIEIISGAEEARLIFNGVSHFLPSSCERLVVDIGGGSTEIISGKDHDPSIVESLPLGCVVFSRRFFGLNEDSCDESQFERAILEAETELENVRYKFSGWTEVVATSGTARALRDILFLMNLNPLDVLSDEITLEGMYKLKDLLVNGEKRIKGLKADRRVVLPGGLAIMIGIFRIFGIDRAKVIDAAIREGILYDMVDRREVGKDVRELTISKMMGFYLVDIGHSELFSVLATNLFKRISVDKERLKFLEWAAKLHSIGLRISHNGYNKHSHYIISESDMPGFSRWEQRFIADLVLSHRSNLLLSKSRLQEIGVDMILAIRFAFLLSRSRNDYLDSFSAWGFSLVEVGDRVVLEISGAREWLFDHPLTMHAIDLDNSKIGNAGLEFRVVGTLGKEGNVD